MTEAFGVGERSKAGGPFNQPVSGLSADDLDPWVYVPAHPVIRDGVELAGYELRELPDGNRVLPTFTSAGLLIEQLGTAQPWLKARIRAVIDLMGSDHVAVNPVIDPAGDRWDRERLEQFTQEFETERGGGKVE
ncbi:MAG: SseB family protein [Nocardiopsaceae bacterium]|nr:SseB family protein [Nocardiopsaceae bacterium]